MFLEIIVFSKKTSNPHDTIAAGWLIAFFLTTFVGIWELRTGNHLSIAKEHLSRENLMVDGAIGSYTSVTFYNINTYAIYILEVIPFVFYTIVNKASAIKKILALYCGLIAMVFLFINGSRGASLSLVLMFLVFLFLIMWKGNKKNKVWAIFALGIILFIVYTYGDAIFSVILYRMQTSGFEDNSRMILYEKSLDLFLDSGGIGTGVGSMVPAMEAIGNQYDVFYSHNLFLEFLMQYGVVLFAGFIFYLFKLFLLARRRQLLYKVVIYTALFGLPFYSVVNSEYTHLFFVWCYFAVLFVFASSNYEKTSVCQIQSN